MPPACSPRRLSRLCTLLSGFLLCGRMDAAEPPASRPNVLVILVDDMGWADPSCYGGIGVPTPAFDRLAKEGMRFTQYYAGAPICSASRAALLTGQYAGRNRITSYLQTRAGNRQAEQADFLAESAPSFVRTFHAAGYATAHVGKWHLGGGRDVTDAPKFAAYGYDVGFGTYESPEPAPALGIKTTPWGIETEAQQVPRHDRTRWMVDQALAFIREHKDGPWLVNLWPDDVHTPHRPSGAQEAVAPKGKGTTSFRAVLKEADKQIGRLLDGLREMKLEENTIVVFASDNGPEPSFERARSGGLRGMKWSLYEGGIREPFIVRWPGKVPANSVNDVTVAAAVDLFPTLCKLAGVPITENALLDGEDLSAVLRGARKERTKALFWEYGRKPADGPSKGAFPYPGEPDAKSPNVAVREGKWKLLLNDNGHNWELYDLAADRNEAHNLAEEKPEIARRLSEAAITWRKSLP